MRQHELDAVQVGEWQHCLSEMEWQVIIRRLREDRNQEIAAELGMRAGNVSNVLDRVERKLWNPSWLVSFVYAGREEAKLL